MSGVAPYTGVMVAPGNRIMMARWRELMSAEGKEKDLQSKERLADSRARVRRWANLNYGRAFLPFAGALIAWTTW